MKQYVIALDQGTTSSRAILFDREQNIIAMGQKEFPQHYPKAGYVEHDPMEIYSSQYGVMVEVLAKSNVQPEEIAAIGITNQRETTIVWDKETGRPIYNAIVWQCRRTAPLCEELKRQILDNVPDARQMAKEGRLLFGTVDTWLIWKLTGGRAHVTDYTNASRTMLYDIRHMCWDKKICEALDIPMNMLPEVKPSSAIYGTMNYAGVEIPIAGCAGDQQAALFGQTCFAPGEAKNTYGTGCFLLMNTGTDIFQSKNGLVTTMAASADGTARYALEGSVFIGGAVIQWIRDELHLIHEAADSEYFATRLEDNGGVYVVPAFTGLGAPYWDMYARGAIMGLTRGCNRKHIIRAALESIAYQSRDVLVAMERDTDIRLQELRVDGGASANNFLMQFQSDIIHTTIRRPMIRETTALGAAYLAGLATGVWNDLDEIREQWTLDKLYTPQMSEEIRERNLRGWDKAIGRVQHWEDR